MPVDLTWLEGLLDPGNVANVKSYPSTPTFELNVTISFVGIPLVDMNASLTRGITSLEKMMEPFGNLMTKVTRFVSQPGSYDGVMTGNEYGDAMRKRYE